MHLNLIEQYNHIYTKYKVRNAPSIYANVKVFVPPTVLPISGREIKETRQV